MEVLNLQLWKFLRARAQTTPSTGPFILHMLIYLLIPHTNLVCIAATYRHVVSRPYGLLAEP